MNTRSESHAQEPPRERASLDGPAQDDAAQLGWVGPGPPSPVSEHTATAVAEDRHETDEVTHAWSGRGVEPFTVGDAGQAADVRPGLLSRPIGRPDTAIDAGTAGTLQVRAASVRGLSHRYYGVTRQDDYCLGADDEGKWLVIAVADGVSAGSRSDIAAAVAARYGVAELIRRVRTAEIADLDWADLLAIVAKRIVRAGQAALTRDADEDTESETPTPVRIGVRTVAQEAATTIVYALVRLEPDQYGRHAVHVMALGDTSAWILRRGRTWEALTPIKNEGAAVATSAVAALPFLPEHAPTSMQADVEPGDSIFVMTDGVGDPLGDGSHEVGAFLSESWSLPPDPLTFAAQVGFFRATYDDDRTVVGVWTDDRLANGTEARGAAPVDAEASESDEQDGDGLT